MFKIHIANVVRIIFLSFLLWLICSILIFQTAKIPTASMRQTLCEGDFIFINKMIYGARLPITPLSLPIGNIYLTWLQLPYIRIPGFSEIKYNDVVVFNYPLDFTLPIDKRKNYVKRCIALPGDSLTIINGVVFINNKKLKESENVLYEYLVQVKENENCNFSNKFVGYNQIINSNTCYLYLTKHSADTLRNNKNITSLTKIVIDRIAYSPQIFPNSSLVKWNLDNFGAFYIPQKGRSVLLSPKNVSLYRRAIEQFEKNVLTIKNDSVFINHSFQKTYTFKMNYYFVMGDNRYQSIDSRYWGLLPENHIIGKASYNFSPYNVIDLTSIK